MRFVVCEAVPGGTSEALIPALAAHIPGVTRVDPMPGPAQLTPELLDESDAMLCVVPDWTAYRHVVAGADNEETAVKAWIESVRRAIALKQSDPERVFLVLLSELALLFASKRDLAQTLSEGIQAQSDQAEPVDVSRSGLALRVAMVPRVRPDAIDAFEREASAYFSPLVDGARIDAFAAGLVADVLSLESARESLVQELSQSKEANRVLERKVSTAQSTEDGLKQRISRAERAREIVKAALSSSQHGAEQMEQELAQKDDLLSQARTEQARVAEQLKQKDRAVSALQARIASAEREVEKAKSDRDAVVEALSHMQESRTWKLTAPVQAILDNRRAERDEEGSR